MKTKKIYIAPRTETYFMEAATPLALSDTTTQNGASDNTKTDGGSPQMGGSGDDDHPAKQSPFSLSLWDEL